jgi:hypothetical protein
MKHTITTRKEEFLSFQPLLSLFSQQQPLISAPSLSRLLACFFSMLLSHGVESHTYCFYFQFIIISFDSYDKGPVFMPPIQFKSKNR